MEAEDLGAEVVTDTGCGTAGGSQPPQCQREQEEPPGQPHG